MNDDNILRIANALEKIEKNLSTLVEDAKENKALKMSLLAEMDTLQKNMLDLKENPFGISK